MIIKQISAFVENKPGRLAQITGILAENNVDMRALSIADTTDFGILRIIVDNPETVAELMRKNNITVSVNEVIAVKLDDKPGALSMLLTRFSENDIPVEYLYAFVAKENMGGAYVVIRVEDNEKAQHILEQNCYEGVESI